MPRSQRTKPHASKRRTTAPTRALPQFSAQPSRRIRPSPPTAPPSGADRRPNSTAAVAKNSRNSKAASSEPIPRAHETRIYLPRPSIPFFDAGYQGFYYRFDDDQQYYLGGVQLRWNLFAGMTNTRKVQQAEAGLRELESKRAETEKQLELQTSAARLSLQTAQVQVTGAEAQERFSASEYTGRRSPLPRRPSARPPNSPTRSPNGPTTGSPATPRVRADSSGRPNSNALAAYPF